MMSIQSQDMTIKKTLLTARLIDGFWDRWLAHGVETKDLQRVRPSLSSEGQWIQGWLELATEKREQAEFLKQQGALKQAELLYRTAGLYYNLMQWLYPDKSPDKEKGFVDCFRMVNRADSLSLCQTTYVTIDVEGKVCEGRLRVPLFPKGCVVIINPLDSSKEELFTYELDFLQSGFITLSFDGPGQGETFVLYGYKGSRKSWINFIDQVINYAAQQFPHLPLYLFGTSSGASWAIYGSHHPKVTKTVAVSPALETDDIQLPDYFRERMAAVIEENDFLPTWDMLGGSGSIYLFHGKKDVLVPSHAMHRLKEQLENCIFREYEEEGHCCNFRLHEIRQCAVEWFTGEE